MSCSLKFLLLPGLEVKLDGVSSCTDPWNLQKEPQNTQLVEHKIYSQPHGFNHPSIQCMTDTLC